MLHLIETGRSLERGHLRTISLSIAAHAGLLCAAVAFRSATPVRAASASGDLAHLERVRYIVAAPAPAPVVEHRSIPAKARRAVTPVASPFGKLKTLSLTVPHIDIDSTVDVGDINLTSKVRDSADFAPRTLADAIGAALITRRASAAPPVGGAYPADAVDRIVVPYGNNPKPIYPRSLESQGIEADFTVMFVVDSTGRVDDGTVQLPKDVHRLFTDAVRNALSRSRYLPATLGGRPVRQLVQQEFVFRMRR
jgi:protein TonB